MGNIQLTPDEGLSGRLKACQQLFARLDAGTGTPPLVRLPDGSEAAAGLQPGNGLKAAGVLMCFAILGREEAEPLQAMRELSETTAERPFKRLCQNAADMIEEAPSWNLAGLYACLRTVTVFLPDSPAAEELPGLVREKTEGKAAAPKELTARFAWAENAVIAYFDLPDGEEEARIGDRTFTRPQCRAGICLPPGTEEVTVSFGGRTAVLKPADPMRGLVCHLGFRLGRLFIPARKAPRRLWRRLEPCVRVEGRAGTHVPAMTVISSRGETGTGACVIPEKGYCFLRCPKLDPAKDRWVELRTPGLRYAD